MAQEKALYEKSIAFEDVADFVNDVPELTLVDIINDAHEELPEHNFVTAPGAFEYELNLLLEEGEILESGVVGFEIEIFDGNPNVKRPRPTDHDRLNQALFRAASTAEAIRRYQRIPLMNFNIDVLDKNTLSLPPENISFLGNFVDGRTPDGKLSVEVGTMKFTPDKTLTTAYFAVPPLTDDTFESSEIIDVSNSSANLQVHSVTSRAGTFADQALTMWTLGRDPGTSLQRGGASLATLPSVMSRAADPTDASFERVQGNITALNAIDQRRSLVEERKKVEESLRDYSDDAVIELARAAEPAPPEPTMREATGIWNNQIVPLGYMVRIESTAIPLKRTFEIPKYMLGMRQSFYVRITPLLRNTDAESISVGTIHALPIVFSVNHRVQVNEMLMPVFPPELTLVGNNPGNITLSMKQVDPAGAKSVQLSRQIFNSSTINDVWQAIGKLKFDDGVARITYEDKSCTNIAPNQVRYRAAQLYDVGGGVTATGPTASLIVEGLPNPNASRPNEPNRLVIIATNEPKRIKIEIEDLSPQVIGVTLYRDDLDISGDLNYRSRAILSIQGKKTVSTVNGPSKLTFYDTDVATNRRYRYFCSLVVKPPNSLVSYETLGIDDEHVTRKRTFSPPPVDVSIGRPSVTQDARSGEFTVSIRLLATPKRSEMNFLLSLMESSGVSKVFLRQMEKQKDDFSQLAVFLVERIDRKTGHREPMGFHPPGDFVDGPRTRQTSGASNLAHNRAYTYSFKLCLRPVQSFLTNVYANLADTKVPGSIDKTVLSKKFQSAYAEAFGAVPSDADLLGGLGVEDSFRLGETGIVLLKDVKSPVPRPRPVDLKLTRNRGGSGINLFWRSAGFDEQIREIDHSIVYLDIDGRIVAIGTVPADGRSKDFYYTDSRFASQIGKKQYYVRFVYTDLTMSPDSNRASHEVITDVPVRILDDRYEPRIRGERRPGRSAASERMRNDRNRQPPVDVRRRVAGGTTRRDRGQRIRQQTRTPDRNQTSTVRVDIGNAGRDSNNSAGTAPGGGGDSRGGGGR